MWSLPIRIQPPWLAVPCVPGPRCLWAHLLIQIRRDSGYPRPHPSIAPVLQFLICCLILFQQQSDCPGSIWNNLPKSSSLLNVAALYLPSRSFPTQPHLGASPRPSSPGVRSHPFGRGGILTLEALATFAFMNSFFHKRFWKCNLWLHWDTDWTYDCVFINMCRFFFWVWKRLKHFCGSPKVSQVVDAVHTGLPWVDGPCRPVSRCDDSPSLLLWLLSLLLFYSLIGFNCLRGIRFTENIDALLLFF